MARKVVLTRETVLTTAEVAAALKVSVRTVNRSNLPCCYIGRRTKRYIWGAVLDALSNNVDLVTPRTIRGRR